MVFLKEFFEKVDFEKNQETTKSMKNYPGGVTIEVISVDNNFVVEANGFFLFHANCLADGQHVLLVYKAVKCFQLWQTLIFL